MFSWICRDFEHNMFLLRPFSLFHAQVHVLVYMKEREQTLIRSPVHVTLLFCHKMLVNKAMSAASQIYGVWYSAASNNII
jgi:hypothetical protein